jgi:hypothetical protein
MEVCIVARLSLERAQVENAFGRQNLFKCVLSIYMRCVQISAFDRTTVECFEKI